MIEEVSPADESRSLTSDALAEALMRVTLPEFAGLLNRLPPLVDRFDRDRREVAQQLALIGRERPASLEELLLKLHAALGGLDRALVNCVFFMERAALQWDKISPLDRFVKQAFQRRRPVFAALLLDQPEFVLDASHPMARLLTLIEELFMGWEEEKGQPPAFIMKALAALTHLLDADHCLDPREQQQALDILTAEWDKESRRRQQLEKRLIDSELGLDQARYGQWLAASVVNRCTGPRLLPPEIIQFLQGPWLDSMRLVLAEQGEDSAQFGEMKKITEQLVFAFMPLQSEKQFAALYNFAVALLDNIGRNLRCLLHAPIELQQQLDLIERYLMAVIKREGEGLERQVAEPVRCEHEIPATSPEADTEHQAALTRVLALQGQWFRREGRLCKVLALLPRQQKLLWSDFAGRKAGLDPAITVLADWEGGRLEPFNDTTRLHGVFLAVARALISLDRLERLRTRDQLRKEKQLREEARQKAEAEALAIIKAREEEEQRLAEERRLIEERLQQERLEAEEKNRLEQLAAARDAIDGLKLGDVVTLLRESGPVAATLAVRLNASRKLIFTNAIGLRVAELQRDEAVDQLLRGQIELGDKGGQNEAWRARFMGRMGVGRKS